MGDNTSSVTTDKTSNNLLGPTTLRKASRKPVKKAPKVATRPLKKAPKKTARKAAKKK